AEAFSNSIHSPTQFRRRKMTKSDSEIERDVKEELKWEPGLPDAADIAVSVKNGVVTLAGFTKSYSDKFEAEAAAKRVAGVLAVANDLEVRLPAIDQRPDPDIARDAVAALKPQLQPSELQRKIMEASKRNAEVDANRITVEAKGSEVILKGTVRSWIEREEAERVAWSAPGITKVEDRIVVSP